MNLEGFNGGSNSTRLKFQFVVYHSPTNVTPLVSKFYLQALNAYLLQIPHAILFSQKISVLKTEVGYYSVPGCRSFGAKPNSSQWSTVGLN